MLSEHVIPFVMSHPLVWLSTFGAYLLFVCWLGWHWWFQYKGELMKQEQVDLAMDRAAAVLGDNELAAPRGPINRRTVKCAASKTVYAFLSGLIDASTGPFPTPGYFVRQALRTARGFVKQWQERNGC